jgi:hypothetical protein
MLARIAETKPLNARVITSVYVQYLDERQTHNPEAAPDPNELPQSLEDLDDEAIQSGRRRGKNENSNSIAVC